MFNGKEQQERFLFNNKQKKANNIAKIFVYFAEKSITSSPRQVRPVIVRSTKFYQGLRNFKDAVVLLRSRTNSSQA